jgi:hypothetical protein
VAGGGVAAGAAVGLAARQAGAEARRAAGLEHDARQPVLAVAVAAGLVGAVAVGENNLECPFFRLFPPMPPGC